MVIVALAVAVCAPSLSAAHTVGDLPNVQRADRSRHLSDPDDIIPADVEQAINRRLADIRRQTTAEVAVVVVDDVDTDENDFATRLFEEWGIGKDDKDNGVLVLVVRDRRRAVIRTGYGTEGVLPDVVAYRIIRDDMAPDFARGDYGAGVLRAVDRIGSILEDPSVADELHSDQPEARTRPGDDDPVTLGSLLFMWFVLGVVLTIVLAGCVAVKWRSPNRYDALDSLKRAAFAICFLGMGVPLVVYLPLRYYLHRLRNAPRKCPNCGTVMQKLDEESDNFYLTPSQDLEEKINSVDYDVWLCPHCGETDIYPFVTPDSGYIECEKCHARTCRHTCDRVTVPATTRSEGHGVREYTCLSCHHTTRRPFIIPRKEDVAGAVIAGGIISSLGHRSGGGFGGGGFSGGGFGGGSTGGGGASGGW